MGNNPSRPSGSAYSGSHYTQDRLYSKGGLSTGRRRRGYREEEERYDEDRMREEQLRQQGFGSPFPPNMPQQGYFPRACYPSPAMDVLIPMPSLVFPTQNLRICRDSRDSPLYSLNPRCTLVPIPSSLRFPCRARFRRQATHSLPLR